VTRYAAGRRKEYDAVQRLRAAGWRAQRSAGSRGLWDVVAVKPGQRVRLIQCKYTALAPTFLARPVPGVLDANARALLALEASDVPCDVELWVYHRGTAQPLTYVTYPGTVVDWMLDASRLL